MGERIEQERVRLGWSQQQLADRVRDAGGKITQSGIDRLEKRGSSKSASSVYIAKALGVNHDWLTSGKGARDTLRSIDRKMELLSPDDFDDLYEDFEAIIDSRLERRGIRK